MDTTTNYGLKKPAYEDGADIETLNENADAIDTELKANADNIAAHKADKNNPHGVTAAQVGAVPTTRKVNGHALSADVTVTKADVGLSNVNNTSDANKPVSTATQEKINDLAGSSRTTETVKGNADNIAALQSGKADKSTVQISLSEKANFTKVTGSPDFNALTTTGLYGVATSSYTNGPSGIGNWGLLIVDKSGNGTQTFLPDGKLYSAYRRNGNSNGTWNAWNEEEWVTPDQIAAWTAKAEKSDIPTSLPANGGNAATLNGHGTDNGPNSVLLSGRKEGTTIGNDSTAEGWGTTASGSDSHAEGYYTTASDESSHAEGSSTTASGGHSHAEGYYTQANGSSSHAEGDHTQANSSYSHAEGYSTTASGSSSHAEGGSTTASGGSSHAEGLSTKASGSSSHAEGYGTTASGDSSHAEGYGTTANVSASHAQGRYNKALAGDPSAYDATADAMVIGNGSYDALSNCFRITFGGNVYGLSSYHSSGADYSEFFEWQDENPSAEDRVGHFVTLDGEKIKYANNGDYVVGITSGNPAVIGDHPSESWKERYLRDVFGRLQYEDVTIPAHDEKDKSGKVIRTIPEHTETHFKVNPDYDPAKEAEYANREKRPEWATVGMLGKLVVIDDGTCEVNGYCKPKNGTATKSDTGYRVLARLDETHIKVLMK